MMITSSSETQKTPKGAKKIPYHYRPLDMKLDDWQIALRRQFAEGQQFYVTNIGNHLVFSDFHVYNEVSGKTYKVAIRSVEPGGQNFCSCMDFKTNNLGTCKHIEYVLRELNSDPITSDVLLNGYQPHYTSVYLEYGAERRVKIRVGTENRKEFNRFAEEYFRKDGVLKVKSYNVFEVFLEKGHALHPEFRCYPDALSFILQQRESWKRNELIDKLLREGDLFFDRLIKAKLFPYQKQGIEFALRKGRVLIADDMGLGKTIQALAAAEGLKQLFVINKVLIVCPTSLKYQWKSEIQKFTDSDLTILEGNIYTREKQYDTESFYKICSYNVVGRDLAAINSQEFDLVILDEAQRIKNWQTKTANNVKKIATKYAFVLTGTPIENKLEELYSVVQMVDPFKLGALFRFIHEHRLEDTQTGKVTGYTDLHGIKNVLEDLMIRRHKKDVLKQLPERMDKHLLVPMTEKQALYHQEYKEVVAMLILKWMRHKFLSESDRQKLLINLNLMRMVCDSTYIIEQDLKTRFDTKIEELMNILDEVLESGDDKVVIFSQWERMTRLVAWELEERGIKFENLHGGIPAKAREALFFNFNNDPESKVFLSTDAGGVGLNLQAGSVIINLDLPWNPAVLEQRIARVHRMGQTKKVQVINLISQGTIEEEMLDKLKFKSDMALGILDNGEDVIFVTESKFDELMKTVINLTEVQSPEVIPTEESIPDESEYSATGTFDFETGEEEDELFILEEIEETYEVVGKKEPEDMIEPDEINRENHTNQNESEDILHMGAGFLEKLMETLSDKEKTSNLVKSLVKTDSVTGQTYLNIPVKNTEIVENGLYFLAQLFGK